MMRLQELLRTILFTRIIYKFRYIKIFKKSFIQPCPEDGSEPLSATFVSMEIGYFPVDTKQ